MVFLFVFYFLLLKFKVSLRAGATAPETALPAAQRRCTPDDIFPGRFATRAEHCTCGSARAEPCEPWRGERAVRREGESARVGRGFERRPRTIDIVEWW